MDLYAAGSLPHAPGPSELEAQVKLECLRCHTVMDYLGRRRYLADPLDAQIALGVAGIRHDEYIVYRCPACGKVEFFEFIDTDITCLECGATIEVGATACPKCGWSWNDSASSPQTDQSPVHPSA